MENLGHDSRGVNCLAAYQLIFTSTLLSNGFLTLAQGPTAGLWKSVLPAMLPATG